MATRRITRARGGSPVPIIVLSVVVVGLLGSTVVLGLSVGDLEKKNTNTQQKYDNDVKTWRLAEANYQKYFRLMGFMNHDSAQLEFETLKEELLKKAPLPSLGGEAEAGAAKTFIDLKTLAAGYAERCAALDKVVVRLEQELRTAKDSTETTSRDAEQTAKTKDEQIAAGTKSVADLRTQKTAVEGELDKTRTALTGEVEDGKGKVTKLTKDVGALEKDVKVRDAKIDKLVEKIKDLERVKKPHTALVPNIPEPADGKILTADADGQYVMVDIGRRDWVEVGMFFSVLEKGDTDTRREKGQIQIRAVYDEIARAKVIKQDQLDPLLPGMVVANPAFKRGTKLEFVLAGGFNEPGIEQLLSRYPCTIAKDASLKTDYVITGDKKPDESKGQISVEEDPNVLFARQNGIFIMRERDLLHYLGER